MITDEVFVPLARIQDELEAALPSYLADLETLVSIESGSYAKAGVDQVGSWMASRLEAIGASIERHPDSQLGDTIVATFEGQPGGRTVLLLGHADTVFEDGFLASRPFEVTGNEIMGPGAGDMKGGLLLGLYALRAIRAVAGGDSGRLPAARVLFIVNPDEEIGSPVSTPIIKRCAREADVALVLEPGRRNGDIVSARKGMMHLRVTIAGRAAHAGVEPAKGRSAVLEAAHKTVALHALNGRWDGVTVNVGSIVGGTRPNIVPDSAVLLVDMRARLRSEQDEAEAAIRHILEGSTVPDVETVTEITALHRPMEKTPDSARLVAQAVEIAAHLGFSLSDTATGGGSDANTTAAMGVPSIDGLGPIGGNEHTPLERVSLDSIVPRATLLAGLILAQSSDRSGTTER